MQQWDSFASIIESAVVPQDPVKPNRKLYLAASFLIGLLLGCGIILSREFLDNTIKTSSDVKKHYGLSTISQIAYDKAYNTKKRQLAVIKEPESQVAESIRELRTNLKYFNVDKKKKIIGITSAQLEEGKSFVSANLAVILAHSGIKTILVNADLRRPVIHKYFNFNNTSGITSMLTGYSKLADEIKTTDVKNLHFLPSGPIPPNPAELLETDLIVLARQIDSIMIVARAGKVTKAVAAQAMEKTQVIKDKLMGVVLNGIVRKGSYYYYYK